MTLAELINNAIAIGYQLSSAHVPLDKDIHLELEQNNAGIVVKVTVKK